MAVRVNAKGKASEWRCFHCDEVFTDVQAARTHFGDHELCDPACKINAAEYRRMERYYQRCLAEDSDSDREFYSMRADHQRALKAEEEKGFERGLKAQLESIPPGRSCPYCEKGDQQ